MKINHINAAQPYTNYNGSNKTNPFKDNPSFAGKVYMPKLTNIKKELIFFGPPGCGKGTQTGRLSEELGLPHIDTGSLLRAEMAAGTEEGKAVKSFIEQGQLVPTQLIASMIKNKLASKECKNGYILDGFPRNIEQAKLLEQINEAIDAGKEKLFKALYFEINPKILLERIIYRQSCPKCGEIYNKKFKPAKIENQCDTCHITLKTRADDNEEVAKSRFGTYFEQTAPLIDFYENKGVMQRIDATGTIEEVWNRLFKAVNE